MQGHTPPARRQPTYSSTHHYKLDAHNKRAAAPVDIHASRATDAMGCLHCGILWLLRVSELINFRWSDVSFSLDHISITLHQSKTDPFRRGCIVQIFRTKSSTCPHHPLDRYHKVSGDVTPSAPLYQAGKFHPLSRAAVTNTLRQLLKQAGTDHSHYSSHSFRIGAATTAAAAGLPAWLIKNLGRWSSNAYLTYGTVQL